MKKTLSLLTILCLSHPAFAMNGSKKTYAKVADIQKNKPKEVSNNGQTRRETLAAQVSGVKDLTTTMSKDITTLSKDMHKANDLNAHAVNNGFQETKDLLYSVLEMMGKVEERIGSLEEGVSSLSKRIDNIQSTVATLEIRSHCSLDWPAMFDTETEK